MLPQFFSVLPDDDENFEKICTINQIFPSDSLREEIAIHLSEKVDSFSNSGSETINYYHAENENCHTYIFIIYPGRIFSDNKPSYWFASRDETQEHVNFAQAIANNFQNIWESLEASPYNVREILYLGGVAHIYLNKTTGIANIFVEPNQFFHPPDELVANN